MFKHEFFSWNLKSNLIYSNENCKVPRPHSLSSRHSCLPLASALLSWLHVHPSGSAPVERGGPGDCPHKLCGCRRAEGLKWAVNNKGSCRHPLTVSIFPAMQEYPGCPWRDVFFLFVMNERVRNTPSPPSDWRAKGEDQEPGSLVRGNWSVFISL